MTKFPRDRSLDSTLALLREGYTFTLKRFQRYQSDVFITRLMFRTAICVVGEDAAKMFYHPDRFTRRGAIPPTALRLLQDKGSVQLLEGEAHRHRKQMFMSFMNRDALKELLSIAANQWDVAINKWIRMDRVTLHNEVEEILCRTVFRWAGVPLTEQQVKQRTREFSAMIDGAGAMGPRNWRGLLLRARTERWCRHFIKQVRARNIVLPEGCPAHCIAWHRDLDGKLLDVKTAAVELINVLRPTVAVARFITFSALALHEYPEWRNKLQSGNEEDAMCFVQEVRRYYPFFPMVGGIVRNEFEWRGHHFVKGTWVLFDIYGTNHDGRLWEQSETFQPERFRSWIGSAHALIPQGGGNYSDDHRCAGEWITLELTKLAANRLADSIQYVVPQQDLHIDLTRIPAIPKSRFVIGNVEKIDRRAVKASKLRRLGQAAAALWRVGKFVYVMRRALR